jgi:N-acetylmuramoyl-L-alanine amidase
MKKIIVDAGHGPNTPGKRSPDGTLREFVFNEAVAINLKKLFSDQGFTVIFPHDNTRDVALSERISLANKMKVDAFVSIHANAYGTTWNEAHGIETYTCLLPNKTSLIMAEYVQQSLLLRTGRKNRGLKKGNFAVLRETKMPAILVECGFMTNKVESNLLKTQEFQQQCAEAIYFGILCSLR